MPIRRGPLTVKYAHSYIEKTVTTAETRFFLLHSRPPSLVEERDYVLLADFLDITDIDRQNRYPKKPGYGDSLYQCPAIPAHDIAHILLRHFLERQGFFAGYKKRVNRTLFDGLMGRLTYNVPADEYAYRIEKITALQAMNVPFPADFDSFIETIECVSKACFLPTIYQKVSRTPAGDATRKGYTCVGTCIVNPAKGYLQLLRYLDKRELELEVFKRNWEEIRDEITDTEHIYR